MPSDARHAHWLGLAVAPEMTEADCPPYSEHLADYRYPADVEALLGRFARAWSIYDGTEFADLADAEIEHIVFRAEAHYSGLCLADADTRRQFARDPLNLALATPDLNRKKHDHDAGEWLPPRNQCWFSWRVLAVRRAYQLTVDPAEAAELVRGLADCGPIETPPE